MVKNKKEYDHSLYNAIKHGLTKEEAPSVEDVELKTLKELAVTLGIETKATTVEGLRKAITEHNKKPNVEDKE